MLCTKTPSLSRAILQSRSINSKPLAPLYLKINLSSTSARQFSEVNRSLSRPAIALRQAISKKDSPIFNSTLASIAASRRPFSVTTPTCKGLSPETENPQPTEPEASGSSAAPAPLTDQQYNEISDDYMNAIVEKLEQLQEEREDVDVEYSAGVLTLNYPPAGTYILNKQPPNKQIWLSSPVSGPKRYDYVILGDGQDSKEGTGQGEWVYLRDMTRLDDLLLHEVGVDLSERWAPAPHYGE